MSYFICDKDEHCIDCPKNYPEEKCEHWIEVEEVKHAKWVTGTWCSNCSRFPISCDLPVDNKQLAKTFEYCPHCGAKIDGGVENG